MTDTREPNDWPYDADRHDPLTQLRIPVTSAYPHWRYTATFDRESEVRPTDVEAQMLASFIEEYREYFFNETYKAKLSRRPFDTDAVTRVFHKWGDDDWSYRVVTWEYGPFWFPCSPHHRGGQYDDTKGFGPMSLIQVMDRIHTIGNEPMKHWVEWKATHLEIFGEVTEHA